jgi:hypothetical protein
MAGQSEVGFDYVIAEFRISCPREFNETFVLARDRRCILHLAPTLVRRLRIHPFRVGSLDTML